MTKCPKCGKQHKGTEHLTKADKTAIIETLDLASVHAYDTCSFYATNEDVNHKNTLDNFINKLESNWFDGDVESMDDHELSQDSKDYIIEQMELAVTHAFDPNNKKDRAVRDKQLIPFIRKLRKKWGVNTLEIYDW